MTEPTTFEGFYAWLQSLPVEFAFLLLLPLLVAIAGVLRVTFFADPSGAKRSGGDQPVVYLKRPAEAEPADNEDSDLRDQRARSLRKGAAS